MRKYIVLLIVFILSGCSHYEWQKPGSTSHQSQIEETACNADALKTLPPDNVISRKHSKKKVKVKEKNKSSDKYYDLFNDDSDEDDDTNFYTKDANSGSRDVLIKNCMYQKGWNQVLIDN